MLKFTIDTPCNHENEKLPVLDLQVNINIEENQRLDFEFYEKPTKHPNVILASSALSMDKKRTILTQECLRIIRNTKIELGENVRNKHLSKFMIKLKNSGYNEKFRKEVVNSAIKAFQKMVDDSKKGIKPVYRDRFWNSEQRREAKLNKKRKWYQKDGSSKFVSVLFVPPTPGMVLAKDLQKREEELNRDSDERFKIVESGGVKIEEILTQKNPFKKEKCEDKECPLCKNKSKIKAFCNTKNIGYRWICEKRNIIKI